MLTTVITSLWAEWSTKSGDVEGYSAAYAADGNNDTRWASGHPDDAANHDYNSFLTLDLAAYYDIDYVGFVLRERQFQHLYYSVL